MSRAYARSLQRLRTARGMSRAQLAIRAGTHPDTIRGIEDGRRGCGLHVAHALAAALGTGIDAMIAGDGSNG